MHVSFNFKSYLTLGQYPTNPGCAKARKDKVQANYMYGDIKNCAYGIISKIPFILYHEETETVPYNFVALKLNSFEGHELYVDFVGMNVLHGKKMAFLTRFARDLKAKNHFK
jgi:hypothetical protein